MTDRPDHAGLQQALQHERALRCLAAALLRDPADAEDAVQHALVQEATGRRKEGTPLWPFLRATLQHHAANLRKLAMRRSSRERAAARTESVPAADELVQREQLRRRVADAVLALAEPYRTTVWLRWFEELSAADVAARMAVPVATVRTRLQRAHELLRLQLDREYGDRRWAVLAAPVVGVGIAVPVVSGLAVMLTMKKVLLAVSILLVAVLGYVLMPPLAGEVKSARGEVAAVAASGEPRGATQEGSLERQEVATTPAAKETVASRVLCVLHADGTPAANLPVWFWNDEATRPFWTRRVTEDRLDDRPPGVGTSPLEAPPSTSLRTDNEGHIPWTVATPPVAVTVQCDECLWFSASLPAESAPLVLPALVSVVGILRGAPADSAWEGYLYATWESSTGGEAYGNMRANVDTRSGQGVYRMNARHFDLASRQEVRSLAPGGQRVVFNMWGRGFKIREPEVFALPPCLVEFHFAKLLPKLRITILDEAGEPTAMAGRVLVETKGWGGEPLVQGHADFDVYELGEGSHLVVALMEDGERLRGKVDLARGDMAPQGTLRRGSGLSAVHITLPDLPGPSELEEVLVEGDSHQLLTVHPFADSASGADHPFRSVSNHTLHLNVLPVGWTRGYVVASDGRVGRFGAGMPGETIVGQWLPRAEPQTIDLGEHLKVLGDPKVMYATLSVGLPNSLGEISWQPVLHHERAMEDARGEPLPVWRDVRLPLGLRARLNFGGAQRFYSPDWTRREIDLTPR